VDQMGGTMRLGRYDCVLAPHSFALQAYGTREINERHRHRYEVNKEFVPQLTAGGLKVTGTTPDGKFIEILEIDNHPWFLACQFHPEFKSKPLRPHPLFVRFIEAADAYRTTGKDASSSKEAGTRPRGASEDHPGNGAKPANPAAAPPEIRQPEA